MNFFIKIFLFVVFIWGRPGSVGFALLVRLRPFIAASLHRLPLPFIFHPPGQPTFRYQPSHLFLAYNSPHLLTFTLDIRPNFHPRTFRLRTFRPRRYAPLMFFFNFEDKFWPEIKNFSSCFCVDLYHRS